MNEQPFVLDRVENPHPRMLAGALRARSNALATTHYADRQFWRGYLRAMADATGCTEAEIEAWMDSHE